MPVLVRPRIICGRRKVAAPTHLQTRLRWPRLRCLLDRRCFASLSTLPPFASFSGLSTKVNDKKTWDQRGQDLRPIHLQSWDSEESSITSWTLNQSTWHASNHTRHGVVIVLLPMHCQGDVSLFLAPASFTGDFFLCCGRADGMVGNYRASIRVKFAQRPFALTLAC